MPGGGVLDPEAGQVVRVTGLVFLFKVWNSRPDRNRMAEMIPMMSIGCSCLNMLTMMMMAVSSMKMANCPDDRPKNLIGLLILRMVLMALRF